MLKAVIWDMDGVIVDTEPLHREAYYAMFEEVGIEMTDALYESFTGRTTHTICEIITAHYRIKETPETLMALKRKHFKRLFDTSSSLQLIDGVLERIQEYHQYGLVQVCASSASLPNINRVFARFDLDQYFIAKFSGADLKASKPHPEIFLKAAAATGHPKESCIVIEDSTAGVKAAHSADIFCVAYQSEHTHNQDYTLANTVIKDFKEIEYAIVNNWV